MREVEQVVQRDGGCPIPGRAQGQVAQGSEWPDPAEDALACCRRLRLGDLKLLQTQTILSAWPRCSGQTLNLLSCAEEPAPGSLQADGGSAAPSAPPKLSLVLIEHQLYSVHMCTCTKHKINTASQLNICCIPKNCKTHLFPIFCRQFQGSFNLPFTGYRH